MLKLTLKIGMKFSFFYQKHTQTQEYKYVYGLKIVQQYYHSHIESIKSKRNKIFKREVTKQIKKNFNKFLALSKNTIKHLKFYLTHINMLMTRSFSRLKYQSFIKSFSHVAMLDLRKNENQKPLFSPFQIQDRSIAFWNNLSKGKKALVYLGVGAAAFIIIPGLVKR